MTNPSVRVIICICLLPGLWAAPGGGMAPGRTHPSQPSRDWRSLTRAHRDGGRAWNQPFASYPAFFGPAEGDAPAAQNSPGAVIVMAPTAGQPTAEPAAVPATPIRSQITEYSSAQARGDSAPVFAIVLNDGTVRRASAVWRQDSVLNYTGPDGAGGEVDVLSVDRDATRRANSRDLLQ